MPSKSSRQAVFMAACSHGAGYPSCPPAKVSMEFNKADKGGKLLAEKRPGGHGKPLKGNGHGR
jgi:hypothetical protein